MHCTLKGCGVIRNSFRLKRIQMEMLETRSVAYLEFLQYLFICEMLWGWDPSLTVKSFYI